MSRSLSITAREAVFAQQTGEVFLFLLELDHESYSVPVRVVNDYNDITSNGNLYTAFPFQVVLPKNSEEISKATLIIDNVSRELIASVRSIDTGLSASLSLVLASSPDTIEAGPFNFTLTNVMYNAMTIRGELNYENILSQQYPKETFTPQNHPGLF